MASFDFDEWLAPRDIAKRGIDAIPDHPYIEDAQLIWPAFERIVERHLDELSIGDDDEVCGNLSPILGSRDDRDKLGINFEHLRSFADPDRENEQPVAAEVLLMDQDDPRLSEAIKELQGTLDDLASLSF